MRAPRPAPTRITVELPRLLPWQRKLVDAVRGKARFVVAVMGRRAGKTTAAADIAGNVALDRRWLGIEQPTGNVFWGAPTHDIASLGIERLRELWRPCITKSKAAARIEEFVGGGRVVFRSFDRPGSALGRGNDLVVIDEAARVRKRIVYEDILPTVADTGGKVIAITTPRGRGSWVHDWYQRARAGDPLYAAVHGPSTENPAPEIRDFVELARENMPDKLYRQEILAEFVEGEGAVFRGVRELATLETWRDGPVDSGSYVIGIDLAKHEDYTVAYALHAETGELHGCDRFRGVAWDAALERIRAFCARWRASSVWIDATGVGDPIYDQLATAGLPVAPVKFTSHTKSQLVVGLMTALERREIRYPADDVLLDELEAYGYEQMPSGRFVYGAPEGRHDDCVMALALAVYGLHRGGAGGIVEWI